MLLGDERYKQAQSSAKAWYSAAFGIVTSAIGARGGYMEAMEKWPEAVAKIKIARGRVVAAAMNTAMSSAESLKILSPVAKEDFAAFVMSAHMRRSELGANILTPLERRSLDMVDQYAAGRTATKPETVDLPPDNLLDSFQPKQEIVFELINSSGVRKLDPGAAKKAERPAWFDSQAPSKAASNPDVSPPPGFDPDAPSGPLSSSVRMQRAENSVEDIQFSDDIPNRFEERVPDDAAVKVLDGAGGESKIELGMRLGEGSTSEAFALLDDPENFVVRITYLQEGSAALHLDAFGDNVLRNVVKSEHVRAVKIRDDYRRRGLRKINPGALPAPAVRVTVAERITPAYQTLSKQKDGLAPEFRVRVDGTPREFSTMSAAQMQAYDGAMRDLNAQGYVWLDNKPDNFGFVDRGRC
ncbi:MAG: hypothetical protein LRZ85_09045, partial [Alphaproteobacteria bacterium]|nr:hypothetical protein [Alphaproteobacteria bacterium]